MMCDLGCCLVLISFVVMTFVEVDDHAHEGTDDDIVEQNGFTTSKVSTTPSLEAGTYREYQERYRRWRMGKAVELGQDPTVGFLNSVGSLMLGLSTAECAG